MHGWGCFSDSIFLNKDFKVGKNTMEHRKLSHDKQMSLRASKLWDSEILYKPALLNYQ